MLRIQITRDGDNIKKIILKGHANYSDYGTDIVCAAASATYLCTINAIFSINNEALLVHEEESKKTVTVLTNDDITTKLIDNMIRCFLSLEKKYPKNITVK